MSKMKEERFMVIGSDNQIYYNEFGADEEVMTLEDAQWLLYKLADGVKEDRLQMKVMELVEVVSD